MQIGDKIYLGDRVYAMCDGYSIVLSIEREGAEQAIFLEPQVLVNLDSFRRELAEQYSAPQYRPKEKDE
jgi:hypothetical protein